MSELNTFLLAFDSLLIAIIVAFITIVNVSEKINQYKQRNDKPITKQQLDYLRHHDKTSSLYLPEYLR